MYKLDNQEKLIIRELIKDPRISDNQIAIKTNVPLKTVNRKRKILEEKGFLNYFCYFNTSFTGTGTFLGRSLYIIVLKEGITRKKVLEVYENSKKAYEFFPKHIFLSWVGDFEGNVAIVTLIESRKQDDLVEIYNAEIIPELELLFGQGCIKRTLTIPLVNTLRAVRNYLPGKNMEKGIIKEDWPNQFIFVDD
jgi:DNA-binding Lrp family transcriptional regulator